MTDSHSSEIAREAEASEAPLEAERRLLASLAQRRALASDVLARWWHAPLAQPGTAWSEVAMFWWRRRSPLAAMLRRRRVVLQAALDARRAFVRAAREVQTHLLVESQVPGLAEADSPSAAGLELSVPATQIYAPVPAPRPANIWERMRAVFAPGGGPKSRREPPVKSASSAGKSSAASQLEPASSASVSTPKPRPGGVEWDAEREASAGVLANVPAALARAAPASLAKDPSAPASSASAAQASQVAEPSPPEVTTPGDGDIVDIASRDELTSESTVAGRDADATPPEVMSRSTGAAGLANFATPLDLVAPLSTAVVGRADMFLSVVSLGRTTSERHAAPSRLFWWPRLSRLVPSAARTTARLSRPVEASPPVGAPRSAANTKPHEESVPPASSPHGTMPPASSPHGIMPSATLSQGIMPSATLSQGIMPSQSALSGIMASALPPVTPPQGAVRVVYEGIRVGRRRPRGVASTPVGFGAEQSAHPDAGSASAVLATPRSDVVLMPPPPAPLPPPALPGLLGETQQRHAIIQILAQARGQVLAPLEANRKWSTERMIRAEDLRVSAHVPARGEVPAHGREAGPSEAGAISGAAMTIGQPGSELPRNDDPGPRSPTGTSVSSAVVPPPTAAGSVLPSATEAGSAKSGPVGWARSSERSAAVESDVVGSVSAPAGDVTGGGGSPPTRRTTAAGSDQAEATHARAAGRAARVRATWQLRWLTRVFHGLPRRASQDQASSSRVAEPGQEVSPPGGAGQMSASSPSGAIASSGVVPPTSGDVVPSEAVPRRGAAPASGVVLSSRDVAKRAEVGSESEGLPAQPRNVGASPSRAESALPGAPAGAWQTPVARVARGRATPGQGGATSLSVPPPLSAAQSPDSSALRDAERHAVLAEVLASLPTAMAAQAYAAGILNRGPGGLPSNQRTPVAESRQGREGGASRDMEAEASGGAAIDGEATGGAPASGGGPPSSPGSMSADDAPHQRPTARQAHEEPVSVDPGRSGHASRLGVYAPIAMVASPSARHGTMGPSGRAPQAAGSVNGGAAARGAGVSSGHSVSGTATLVVQPTRASALASGEGAVAPIGIDTRSWASTPSAPSGQIVQRALDGVHREPVVQQAVDGAGGGGVVQRILDDAPSAPSPAIDLEALADEIYSRLRWRLSAERERTFGVR